MNRFLAYGYGNPGRQDDGLGILLVESWEKWAHDNGIYHIDFDYNYQLNIEDALTISEYDQVVFVDASVVDIQDVQLTKVVPTQRTEFTMHAMYPGFILHLCHKLYGKAPQTYLLSIKGYEFEFIEEITKKAQVNLNMALDLVLEVFSMPDLSEVEVNL